MPNHLTAYHDTVPINDLTDRQAKDEITRKMSAAAVIATDMLIKLATNDKSGQIRLGACRELLNRALGPIPSRSTTVLDKSQRDEMERQKKREEFFERLKAVGFDGTGDEVDAAGPGD